MLVGGLALTPEPIWMRCIFKPAANGVYHHVLEMLPVGMEERETERERGRQKQRERERGRERERERGIERGRVTSLSWR